MDKKTLGAKLEKLRVKRGLSKYKVAQLAGTRIGQINTVEHGEKNYTIDLLINYMKACDITLKDIVE